MWGWQPIHELGTGMEFSKCINVVFGVNMHPFYQITFNFLIFRGAPVWARYVKVQNDGVFHKHQLCLRFILC